jgi:hypothetical protein
MKKITKQEAEELAAHLIELEVEFIQNNMDEFISGFYGWDEKFGQKSIELAQNLTSDSENEFNKEAIKKISDLLIEDFESGFWKKNSDGGLYDSYMLDEYGGFIAESLDKQIHMSSGVGIQLEIF